jgi:hypothetical protein
MSEKQETFTPGPWHAWYCKENQGGGGIFQDTNDIEGDEKMICRMAKDKRVIHEDKRKSDDFVHSAEDEANARLIARAPELLQQCKLFEKVLTESDLSSTHDGLSNCDKLANLRAILDRVEGETSA